MDPLIIPITILGLCIGSFLNVVIARLPIMAARKENPDTDLSTFNLSQPKSHCPTCKEPVRWYQNIPLVSYLALRGRCACCDSRIGFQYPLVELTAGLIAFISFWLTSFALVDALFLMFFGWCALAISGVSFKTGKVPVSISVFLLAAGLLNAFVPITTVNLVDSILGILAALTALYILHLLHTNQHLIMESWLLAAVGSWVGFMGMPLVFIGSALIIVFMIMAIVLARSISGRSNLFSNKQPFASASVFAGLLIYTAQILGLLN